MIKTLFAILAIAISGIITDSRTGNGIEGVVVSDGYSCSVTDARGAYTITPDSLARTISVSLPSEYEVPLCKDGRPLFYKFIPSDNYDFHLCPRKNPSDRFTLIALTDAHITKDPNSKRFYKESAPDIQKTINAHKKDGPVIGVTLGDQLTDDERFTNQIQRSLASFKICGRTMPLFLCIGNHDHHSADGESEYAVTDRFVRGSAPRDYSFNMGGVHFVVMDDIQYTGLQRDGVKIKYYNGLTDSQIEWLKQDVSLVPDRAGKAVVLCMHSPMFGRFSNKDAVKALLKEFKEAHILSGHEHNINNVWIDDTIWEHNLQSICGSWWYSNVSPNGSPLGYAVMTFDGGVLAEEYNKATTESRDFQMRVYSGNDSYNDKTPCVDNPGKAKRDRTYAWPEELAGYFIVRVWDGTKDWEVKFVQNGKEIPMQRTPKKFFDACTCAYMVDVHGAPCGGSSIYKGTLDTFWLLPAPCGDPALEKDWEIVATHKMPSGKVETYRTKVLQRDYCGFQKGKHYRR